MAKFICKCCGCEFDPDEAYEEFDAHYDGRYNYEGWEGYCGECAIEQMGFAIEYNADSDSIPDGCRQCGGDYPNCADSCPRFDD